MSGYQLSPKAQADLDDFWLYVARESGSIEIATRLIEAVTERFWLLAQHPQAGRKRDDLRAGLRSFPVGEYVIIYRIGLEDVLILHVLHGSRDIAALV